MSSMRILLLSNLYGFHARGGAERVVEVEANALRARRHEVAVVSAAPEPEEPAHGTCAPGLPHSLCDAGIGFSNSDSGIGHFTYCPPNSCFYTDLGHRSWFGRLTWHWLDIFNWRSAARMEKIIKAYAPDAVHSHNLMGLGFTISNLLWKLGVRHVHTVHDVQLFHPSGLLPSDWRPHWPHEWIYIWLMRFMMGSPQVVLFPSRHSKEMHGRFNFFPKSTKVVLRNPAERGTDEVGGESDGFLFIGQLEEHKGVLDLLDAWEKWGERGEAKLHVIGDGSLESKVQKRMESLAGADFVGPIYGAGLDDYYRKASYVVVPSRVIENAPMVIVDAFRHGVPAVAAATGGIPELVEEGITGFLFEPGNVDSLLEALRRATAHKQPTALAKKAFNAAKKMTVEAHVEVLESVYQGR